MHKNSRTAHGRALDSYPSGEDESPFRLQYCPDCNYFTQKKYRMWIHLWTHKRAHTGERPFLRNVHRKGTLYGTHHEYIPGIEITRKIHTCTICNYKSSGTSNMKKHLRKHTGEKPYVCSVCQKAFTQQHNLKYHIRSHGFKVLSSESSRNSFVD
ncbi:myoneurin-like [Uloborus diversus]|uniref:myoneurin-like n=1 Tax=Uloborus diversus TaxID=327109 RepID=UPI0024094A9C|nr:myoneurin-like [Uloborus diversus]